MAPPPGLRRPPALAAAYERLRAVCGPVIFPVIFCGIFGSLIVRAAACEDGPLPELPAPAARLFDDAAAPPLPPELFERWERPEMPDEPAGELNQPAHQPQEGEPP